MQNIEPLPSMRHWHIAANAHPERERRLLRARADSAGGGRRRDDGQAPSPESDEPTPEPAPEQEKQAGGAIEAIQTPHHNAALRLIGVSEENLTEALSSRAAKLTLLSGEYFPDEKHRELEERMRAQEPESCESFPPDSPIPALHILEYLQRHPEDERWFLMEAQERIKHPQELLNLARELEGTLRDYEHLEDIIQAHRGLSIGGMDLARADAGLQQIADKLGIEKRSIIDWLQGARSDEELTKEINDLFGLGESFDRRFRVLHRTDDDDRRTASVKDKVTERLIAFAEDAGEAHIVGSDVHSTQKGMLHRVLTGFSNIWKRSRTREQIGPVEDLRENVRILRDALSNHIVQRSRHFYEHLDAVGQEVTGEYERLLREARNADPALQNARDEELMKRIEFRKYKHNLPLRILMRDVLGERGRQLADMHNGLPEHNWAEAALYFFAQLEEMERAENRSTTSWGFLEEEHREAQKRHEEIRSWARKEAEQAQRTLALIEQGDGDITASLKNLGITLNTEWLEGFRDLVGRLARVAESSDTLYDNERLDFDLDRGNMRLYARMFSVATGQKLKKQVANSLKREAPDVTERTCSITREKLLYSKQKLLPDGELCDALNHTICNVLPIEESLRRKFAHAENQLKTAESRIGQREPEEAQKAAVALKDADELIEQLRICANEVAKLPQKVRHENLRWAETEQEYRERTGGTGYAAYVREGTDAGSIVLNRKRMEADGLTKPTDLTPLVTHEYGHAILSALTEKTALFPDLLQNVWRELRYSIPKRQRGEKSKERTFDELLRAQAEEWGMGGIREDLREKHGDTQEARDEWTDLLMDELINQYASWVDEGRPNIGSGDPPLSEESYLLFRCLDPADETEPVRLDRSRAREMRNSAKDARKSVLALQQQRRRGDAGGAEEGGAEDEQPEGGQTGLQEDTDLRMRLNDLRNKVESIQTFYESYPEFRGQLQDVYRNYKEIYDIIQEQYNRRLNGEYVDGGLITNIITGVEEDMKGALDEIAKLKAQKKRTEEAPATGKQGLRWVFDYIDFMSLTDIGRMVKSGGEDIARMWKRRGESVQASTGAGLTGWIPGWVPYAGRLKDEYRKRGHASELGEVQHWREAIKDRDSWLLQEDLGKVRSKDQLRAILEELAERGRINWNYEPFWRTLNFLSNYSMPIEACRNDGVLRDKWLQKIITDIWDDKEHFFKWRQGNDGATESGKKKFTQTADQLSNVSGGLANELETQLRLYVTAKRAGAAMPEEVNPHLYEEIIDYSIRNGKMTMEQKFFYLIQGIRHGIISIDRLQAIAGQHGDILNIFPFIDYFYQRNNTHSYLERLGVRLQEKGEADEFRPGLKTSRFVHMEIARELKVKERLRKGISRHGHRIDHDDIPYFLPEVDVSGVEDWFRTVSGGDQKLTKEALKNGYVGFSVKFKMFASLAKMHREGDPTVRERFTRADLRDMAQTIAAYIFTDNMLTRNAYDEKSRRPWLSKTEIDNSTAVYSLGSTKVGQYRRGLNQFARAAVGALFHDNDWARLSRGITTRTGRNFELDEFVGAEYGRNEYDTDRAQEMFKAGTRFQDMMIKKLEDPRNLERFLKILSAHGETLISDAASKDFKSDDMNEVIRWNKRVAHNGELVRAMAA